MQQTCPSTIVSRVNTSFQSSSHAGIGDAETDISASTSVSGSSSSSFCVSCFSVGGRCRCWTRMMVCRVRDVEPVNGTATQIALYGCYIRTTVIELPGGGVWGLGVRPADLISSTSAIRSCTSLLTLGIGCNPCNSHSQTPQYCQCQRIRKVTKLRHRLTMPTHQHFLLFDCSFDVYSAHTL